MPRCLLSHAELAQFLEAAAPLPRAAAGSAESLAWLAPPRPCPAPLHRVNSWVGLLGAGLVQLSTSFWEFVCRACTVSERGPHFVLATLRLPEQEVPQAQQAQHAQHAQQGTGEGAAAAPGPGDSEELLGPWLEAQLQHVVDSYRRTGISAAREFQDRKVGRGGHGGRAGMAGCWRRLQSGGRRARGRVQGIGRAWVAASDVRVGAARQSLCRGMEASGGEEEAPRLPTRGVASKALTLATLSHSTPAEAGGAGPLPSRELRGGGGTWRP